ncbi:hypothetical protein GXW82_04520 [Streptacidiphilus sp. 4-A2]|nr:hypothetical protein [Streptacidiphilus sp. 4-A2]
MKDPPSRARAGAELDSAFADLSAVERWAGSVGAGSRPGPYIAQDPLEGRQYCVMTETTDGMHRVVAITARPVPGDPRPAQEADQAVLRSLVRSLLDLAGHERGAARTEVVLTAAGPRVLECRLEDPPFC